MFIVVASSPRSLLAQDLSGSEVMFSVQGADSNFSELGSSQNRKVFYPGIRTGIPYFFGFRYEWILKRDADFMPVYILTGDISATLGFGVSLGMERRLGSSQYFVGFGYTSTVVIIPASGSAGADVALGGALGLHSAFVTIGKRTSYQKEKVFNYSIGVLVTPLSFDHFIVFPLLTISITGD
jgi:hypothetical protein